MPEPKTMNCPECDTEVGVTEKKCPKCGLDLSVLPEFRRMLKAAAKMEAKEIPPKQPEPEPESRSILDNLRRD